MIAKAKNIFKDFKDNIKLNITFVDEIKLSIQQFLRDIIFLIDIFKEKKNISELSDFKKTKLEQVISRMINGSLYILLYVILFNLIFR